MFLSRAACQGHKRRVQGGALTWAFDLIWSFLVPFLFIRDGLEVEIWDDVEANPSHCFILM